MTWEVLQADCVAAMKEMDEASVDAVVTDPPYGLGFMGKEWDDAARMASVPPSGTPDTPLGRFNTGKGQGAVAFDHHAFQTWSQAWATEALRVLKPGGHLLAFGGTRTYHRLACAIEDAGFEIRDSIGFQHSAPVFCRCDSVPYSHADDVPGVRQDVQAGTEPREAGGEPELQPSMQRAATGAGVGDLRPPGTKGEDAGELHEGGDAGLAESGVEGRGDVLAEEGELPADQVRPSADVGESDGPEGRLHHGASASDGAEGRAVADEDGSGASPESESAGQRADEPRAMAVEWIAQGGGAWPGCPRCGKPLEPPFFSGPLAWDFGSGFPKSLDVSKAIDRADDTRRPEREALGRWLREQREAAGLQQKEVAAHWPSVTGGLTGCVANWEGGFNCPTLEQWVDLKRIIGLPDDMDAEVWRLNGRKGQPGENWEKREVVGYDESVNVYDGRHAFGDSMRGQEYSKSPITAPATPEAQRWQGWGTALAPSHEPIVVARKPLIGTVAANVLKFGTGGINVDACRVSSGQRPTMGEWENGENLCDSCAEDAGGSAKSTTLATGESSAPSPAALTTSGRGETPPGATSRTATGCSTGPSQEALSAALSADGSSSIDGSGSSTTGEKSPPVTSSITSTGTSKTTESRTCSSCGAPITSAITTPNGRWPKNVALSHLPECQRVGERRVKTNNQQTAGAKRADSTVQFGPNIDGHHYGDPDGLETVEAWSCVEGCPVRELDRQSGERPPSFRQARTTDPQGATWGLNRDDQQPFGHHDSGGVSRFFYVAKASRAERGAGLEPKLRLRSDLTPDEIARVTDELRKAGVEID